MALQHLRSSTANKRPTPAGMSDGQLALNTNDASPGLFFKDSNGALVKVGPVHVGTTAPNASPASGGSSGNSVGEQWLDTTGGTYVFKVWDGSAWRSETGTFVDVNGDVMTGALGIIAGTAGSPGLYISGDTNTGIYSPGADQLALSTNGTGRLFVDASGRVGVGASASSWNTFDRIFQAGNVALAGLDGADNSMLASNLYYGGSPSDFRYVNSTTATLYRQDGGTHRFFSAASGTAGNAATLNERLRITSAGLVGVGTSSPSYLLHLNGSSNVESRAVTSGASSTAQWGAQNTTGATVVMGAGGSSYSPYGALGVSNAYLYTGSDLAIATDGANVIKFATGAGVPERMRLDASGRLGIGSSSPRSNLDITKDGAVAAGNWYNLAHITDSAGNKGLQIGYDNTSQTSILAASTTGTASNLQFYTYNGSSWGPRATITSGGSLGIGTTSPGELLALNSSPSNAAISIRTGGASFNSVVKFNADDTNYAGIGLENTALVMRCSNSSTPTERARIDSSGRLLVGTSSDLSSGENNRLIQAAASNGAFVLLSRTDATITNNEVLAGVEFRGNGNPSASIYAWADADHGTNDYPGRLVFSTTSDGASSPTERMRLDSTGRLFLNTTASPSSSSFGTSIGTVLAHSRDTSTGAVAQIYGSAGEFRIIGSGNAQNTNNSYGAISDQSLKTDISDAGSQWDDIKGITVRKFKLIGTDTLQIGVVAQECELVSPGLVEDTVLEQEDGTTSTVKAVKYSVLYMKAVKALQEAMERIEQLEQRLAAAGI